MSRTLALLHTTPVTVGSMTELAGRLGPDTRVINFLDDSLLADAIRAGQVTDAIRERLAGLVGLAETAGADAVLCCCSSVGEAAEAAAKGAKVPVLRIDAPMAETAATTAHRVGVLATVGTTLEPTAALIRRFADMHGREVDVEPVLVPGAYDALKAGRPEEHDRLVTAALQELLGRVDAVVLAQASMARLVANLKEAPAVPVYSSPESGLRAALQRLKEGSRA
ncbi:MAG TPA: aspartate/glutamate racemase family protein [Deinococcales bacterium]|nr:aspartate/glutamate racemase family protein [Deinococcales bacterium]